MRAPPQCGTRQDTIKEEYFYENFHHCEWAWTKFTINWRWNYYYKDWEHTSCRMHRACAYRPRPPLASLALSCGGILTPCSST